MYHVSKSYVAGSAALQDVSLEILPRTTTCIIGETGSGKSTLGRLLLGLTPPTAGQVRFRGRDVEGLKGEDRRAYRRSVQMVFQNRSILPRVMGW